MTKNPLISVIVPIYNVEKYLNKCLNSIINQTYDNLDIILVDDGSTDTSGKIAEDFAKKDSRVNLIHQANGGLSNARNRGLTVARGEYITFIDSDDYVTHDYVQYLYDLIKNTGFSVKLSLCSLMNHYELTDKNISCGNNEEVVLTGKKCIEMMCYQKLVDTCAYAKLARRELYKKVQFPEGKLFEDIATTYKIFMQCDKVACGFNPKYYYNVRSNSIVTSKFNFSKLELLDMTDQMANDVLRVYPDLKKAVLRRQVYARFSTLNQSLKGKNVKGVQQNLVKYIKNNRQSVLKDKKIPRRDKIAYALLSLGLPCYKFGWKMYEKIKGVK